MWQAQNATELLSDVDGIVVPGGFGERGIDGKIEAITYARTNGVPFFGISLGMQLAAVEYARNVMGLKMHTRLNLTKLRRIKSSRVQLKLMAMWKIILDWRLPM